MLGYYSHLITDALYIGFIRDEKRVKAAWDRIKADKNLKERATGFTEDFDSIKKLVPKRERLHELYVMEAEYLRDTPDSGYITEIMTLKAFPDYIDYLPHGSIVRKIGVMGYMPVADDASFEPIIVTREEFAGFIDNTAKFVVDKLRDCQDMLSILGSRENKIIHT